jgi:hypothetical protein
MLVLHDKCGAATRFGKLLSSSGVRFSTTELSARPLSCKALHGRRRRFPAFFPPPGKNACIAHILCCAQQCNVHVCVATRPRVVSKTRTNFEDHCTYNS